MSNNPTTPFKREDAPVPIADGVEAETLRATPTRDQHVNLRKSDGAEVGVPGAPLTVIIEPPGTGEDPTQVLADQGAPGTQPWLVDDGHAQSLTDVQLRATPVPVSGTVTATPSGTQDQNITKVNGTAQTARDWSADFAKLPPVAGTWGYSSGISGTVVLSGGKRVLQITAIAQQAAASFTINGGDTISLPYGSTDKVSSAITIEPKGNLTDPTVVFTGTAGFFLEHVS